MVEGTLAPGTRNRFSVRLTQGDLLEIVARQDELDIALLVSGPAGDLLLRLDSPVGKSEPEHLLFIAEEDGPHNVEVESLSTTRDGRYRLEIVALSPSTEKSRRRARAATHLAAGHELRRGEAYSEAVERYRQAAEQWRDLGETGREADALDWIGWSLGRQGRLEEVPEALRRAIQGFRASGELKREAVCLDDLGTALRRLGRPEEALEHYKEALVLWRRLHDPAGEAKTLNQIANLHKARNALSAAELSYKEALGIWRRLERRRDEAITLANLAGVYSLVGQTDLALDLLVRASALLPAAGAVEDQAFLLEETGLARRRLGQREQALAAYVKALALRRKAGGGGKAASALDGLARLHYEAGDYDSALNLFREALTSIRQEGDRQREATLLQNLGWVQLRRGEPERALSSFRLALPTLRETGFVAGEAATLAGIARVERVRGHLKAAAAWAQQALDVLEELRAGSDRPDLRASLLATKSEYFDFAIDTLMELHGREPAAGYDSAAFYVSEQARARWLLDTLPSSRRSTTEKDPDLHPALHDARLRVNAAEEKRLRLLTARASAEELGRADRTLRATLEELRSFTQRSRRPEESLGADPRPLHLEEVQDDLLGAGILLLKYDLGEDRSYLWAVSAESVITFTLPPAGRIEEAARDAQYLLSHSHQRGSSRQVEIRAVELSRMLLGPAAAQIARHRRLLVSADAALHKIPFGALPDPAGDGHPLLAKHEITYAPSASVLAWMGDRRQRRFTKQRKTLALVADPVFGADDERFAWPGPAARGAPGSMMLGGLNLRRLPYSEKEAVAVLALVPPAQRLAARGFNARKELVMSGALSEYRILHFATHARFSADHPELSALVLSRIDERHRPQDGMLWAHEISSLQLPAELVVLSACDTALGPNIQGEGLVGLSHAFFRAGTPRVLVSLWRVDDQAALELMIRFYRAFLIDGVPAAEALRQAQLALRLDPRWNRPYFWAGFVLQGEW